MNQVDPDKVFKKRGEISYSALGAQGQLKVVAILNMLQDTAAAHASQLGISGFDLAEKNLAWVISRYRIETLYSPEWQEKIEIKTHRFPWKSLYEIRNFTISGANGSPAVKATAAWVMVKKENKMPVRLNRYMKKELLATPKRVISNPFDEVEKIKQTDFQLPFKIRIEDLDLNQHVNNAIYVGWALETVTREILENFRPGKTDVLFHKSSYYGDTIISRTEIKTKNHSPFTRHAIISKNRDKLLASVNIYWTSMEKNDLK
ncbi:MAG: thioesterase [Desulfobacteraceae bacterium]